MKLINRFFLTLIFFNFNFNVEALEVKPPPVTVNCTEAFSLFYEFYRNGDYVSALPAWRKVFTECPSGQIVVYKGGIKMYKAIIETVEVGGMKDMLVDTLLMIHKQRIEYFGDDEKHPKGHIYRDIGNVLYQYRRDYNEAYIAYQKSLDLMNEEIKPDLTIYIMKTAIILAKNNIISVEQVIRDYTKCSEILDIQTKTAISNNKSMQVNRLTRIKESMEKEFLKSTLITCDLIVPIMETKFKNNSGDTEVVHYILEILKNKKCTSSSLYPILLDTLRSLEPSASTANESATYYIINKKWGKAINALNEAIKLEKENIKKADYHMKLARVYFNQKKFVLARENALKAVYYDPDLGESYQLIADMYLNCFEECGDPRYEKADIYWIVVDMLIKAKTSDPSLKSEIDPLIESYSQNFPTKPTIFFISESGDHQVGGWISRTTKIRARE